MPVTLIERERSREARLDLSGARLVTLRFYAHGPWQTREAAKRALGPLIARSWQGLPRLILRAEKLCRGLWHAEAVYGPREGGDS